ncbi:uncharacterized protein LOC136043726 [Artemia franciscana]|uniref:Uncharacterized protein n=1 Tax=Artemia franciscana TaxID=6661 RepID=A0AA88H0D0_ARTSF|nr:hypothetical protein QYM36_020054 [Artemia franciscana]
MGLPRILPFRVNELMIVNQKKDSVAEFLQAVNIIQRLNPRVKVNAAENGLSTLSDDVIAEYSFIVGTNCRREEIQRLRDIADTKQKCLFIGANFGVFGFFCEANFTKDPENFFEVKEGRHLPFLSIEGGLSNARNKDIGDGFMLSQIVMEFRDKFDRLPEKDKRDEDRKNLFEIREKIRQLSKIEKVSDDMLDSVYGDEKSVGEWVGRRLSEQIVKVITRDEKTIDNFSFCKSFAGPYSTTGKTTAQQLEAE